jgi:hypothetical protein
MEQSHFTIPHKIPRNQTTLFPHPFIKQPTFTRNARPDADNHQYTLPHLLIAGVLYSTVWLPMQISAPHIFTSDCPQTSPSALQPFQMPRSINYANGSSAEYGFLLRLIASCPLSLGIACATNLSLLLSHLLTGAVMDRDIQPLLHRYLDHLPKTGSSAKSIRARLSMAPATPRAALHLFRRPPQEVEDRSGSWSRNHPQHRSHSSF